MSPRQTQKDAETAGAIVCNFALSGKRTRTYESYLPGVMDLIQFKYEKTHVLTPGYCSAQLMLELMTPTSCNLLPESVHSRGPPESA